MTIPLAVEVSLDESGSAVGELAVAVLIKFEPLKAAAERSNAIVSVLESPAAIVPWLQVAITPTGEQAGSDAAALKVMAEANASDVTTFTASDGPLFVT